MLSYWQRVELFLCGYRGGELLEYECPESSSVPWKLSTRTDKGGFGVRMRGAA